MYSKSVQICLTVFAGIFIGLVTAYSVNPVIWWIGVLVGALVGYIAYNPHEAYLAILNVARGVRSLHRELNESGEYGISKDIGSLLAISALWAFTILSWVYFPMCFHWYALPDPSVGTTILVLAGTLCLFWLATMTIACICRDIWKGMDKAVRLLPKFESQRGDFSVKIIHPLWFSFPGIMIQVVLNTLIITVSLVKFAFWIVFTVIKAIHSAERVQCAAYSALGVAVGYWYNGSPLVFAIGGALVSTLVWRLVMFRFVTATSK